MSNAATETAERRPVGRPGAEDPGDPRPLRRGRGHRDRQRPRGPQEHGVPAGRHAGAARPGRAGRGTRQVPPRRRPAPARRRDQRPARRGPGGPTAVQAARRRHRRDGQPRDALGEHSALYLDQVAGPSALQPHNWVGQHIPLHATSNGKVLMGGLADAELSELLGRLPAYTGRRSPTGQAARASSRRPRARVRRRGRRARGRAHRHRRARPQRARRRHLLDERLRPDLPAADASASTRSSRCSSRRPTSSRTGSAGVVR